MASAGLNEDLARETRPFVLTLELDGAAFRVLDDLRRRFFPAERNFIPAHVTLFHQLPGDRARDIKALLRHVAGQEPPLAIEAAEWKSLDRGVALFFRAPRLNALRDRLAAEWQPYLVPQDRGGYRPHVTIQNKVEPAEARRTLAEVQAARLPTIRGVGLHLWRYMGGPWDDAGLFRFG